MTPSEEILRDKVAQAADPVEYLIGQLLRERRIRRMEAEGELDPNCAGCRVFYEHPTLDPFAPRHKAMESCRSGHRPHCTCDTCF